MKCEELNKTQVFRNRRGNVGGEVASRGKRVTPVESCTAACLVYWSFWASVSFLGNVYLLQLSG